MRRSILLTPGPTQVPEEALAIASMPIMHHRTPQFEKIFEEVENNLKYVFQTVNPVLIFTSSGTGGMESVVVNTLSPNDKVIVVVGGKFGERWAEIVKAYGLNVIQLDIPWDTAVKPELINKTVNDNPDVKAIFVTLSETSTGAVTDVKSISNITKDKDILLVVDAISGLGVVDLKTDEWGIDVVIAGSQKGLMIPPGLAFVSVSQKALKFMETSKMPKYYFSWKKSIKNLEKNTTPWTPGISLIMQINEALKLVKEEGLDNVFKRHTRLSKALNSAMKALNLEIYNKDSGDACTAVKVPAEIDSEKMVKLCRDKFKVTLTGGQDQLKGKIFRIATMGNVNENDLIIGVAVVERALSELGYKFNLGAGVAAAMKSLEE
jgi:serine---pyruvate transaminase